MKHAGNGMVKTHMGIANKIIQLWKDQILANLIENQ